MLTPSSEPCVKVRLYSLCRHSLIPCCFCGMYIRIQYVQNLNKHLYFNGSFHKTLADLAEKNLKLSFFLNILDVHMSSCDADNLEISSLPVTAATWTQLWEAKLDKLLDKIAFCVVISQSTTSKSTRPQPAVGNVFNHLHTFTVSSTIQNQYKKSPPLWWNSQHFDVGKQCGMKKELYFC